MLPHRAVYPKKWNPAFQGGALWSVLLLPASRILWGQVNPDRGEEVCKPPSNLFRAPLISCRSQSSGYHELSRIIFKFKSITYGQICLPIGIFFSYEYLSLNHVFSQFNFSLAFTVKYFGLFASNYSAPFSHVRTQISFSLACTRF